MWNCPYLCWLLIDRFFDLLDFGKGAQAAFPIDTLRYAQYSTPRGINMKFLSALLLVGAIAQGSVVEFSGNVTKTGGVDVHAEAKLTTPAGAVPVKLSGSGIRQKTKLFLTFNLYTVASYVSDVQSLRRGATPVDGLRGQKAKVLNLVMLRGLSATEIRQSFEEALDSNGVDISVPEIQSIFAQWKSAVKTGDTIVITGYPEKDKEVLVIEVGGKTITSSGPELSLNFWKIWFGKGDANMLELQSALVGKE
jgi:hypothetical protein